MKINDFLKQIVSDMKMNNKDYTSDEIYHLLKYYGVKKDKSLVKDIESFYEDFVHTLNNSLVKYTKRELGKDEFKTNYLAFYASKKAYYLDAVKVYFPVKYEYMISALKTVFLYLVRNNIEAVVKFYLMATNEGIVIRFYDKKDVMPFINYCNNNFVLKELLEPVNPFIATIYGIGVVRDDNTKSTFNKTVSELLKEYFELLKNGNALDRASDLDFLDYVRKRANIEEDEIQKFNIKEVEKSLMAILNRENSIIEKDLI